MSTANDAAQQAITLYCTSIIDATRDHGPLILQLSKEIEDAGGIDVISDATFEATDGIKGLVSTGAANACEKAADQEEAIGICEGWVAENVANAGTDANVIAFLVGYGVDEGARLIREAIKEALPTPAA